MKRNKIILKKKLRLISEYGDTCFYCGCSVQPHNVKKVNGFTLDHIKAKSKGGTAMVTACKDCNEKKADMDLVEFPKGTLIRVDGIPYQLSADTKVFGNIHNQSLETDADKPRRSA